MVGSTGPGSTVGTGLGTAVKVGSGLRVGMEVNTRVAVGETVGTCVGNGVSGVVLPGLGIGVGQPIAKRSSIATKESEVRRIQDLARVAFGIDPA